MCHLHPTFTRRLNKQHGLDKQRMTEPAAALDKERALHDLAEAHCSFGGYIEVHESVASTMPLAHALASQPALDSGAAVVAEVQETGKGRAGRQWVTPARRALLVSFMLRQDEHPIALKHLPMLTALAVVQACEEMSIPPQRLAIKWPNDIIILDGAGNLVGKVAGVLIETVLSATTASISASASALGGWKHAVIGVGMNVNQRRGELPVVEAPALPPVSMRLFFDAMGMELFGVDVEMQGELDRTNLLIHLCKQLDALAQLDANELLARYRQRLWKPEMPMFAISPAQAAAGGVAGGVIEGMVEDVDDEGRLLLRGGDGVLHTLSSEEVSLRRTQTA